MAKVIGVRFRNVGKLYYFDPAGYDVRSGDRVIVETARGVECGVVGMAAREVGDDGIVKPLKPVIRVANEADVRRYDDNREKEKQAYDICKRKIAEHGLVMKLVDVEYAFDGSKILFYFTADGRVDFRELVKDLATAFHTRIELRQIGVRDESKLLGGIGMCGKPFCCSTFLFDFQPVSIKMAKEQGKSLNPTKISGACGRLMCCLKYEQDVYEELADLTPRVGAIVRTPEGEGTVVENNVLATAVKVRFEGDNAPRLFKAQEVTVIGGKQRRKKPEPEAEAAPQEASAPAARRGAKGRPKKQAKAPRAEAQDTTAPEAYREIKLAPEGGATPPAEGEEPRRRPPRRRRPSQKKREGGEKSEQKKQQP